MTTNLTDLAKQALRTLLDRAMVKGFVEVHPYRGDETRKQAMRDAIDYAESMDWIDVTRHADGSIAVYMAPAGKAYLASFGRADETMPQAATATATATATDNGLQDGHDDAARKAKRIRELNALIADGWNTAIIRELDGWMAERLRLRMELAA